MKITIASIKKLLSETIEDHLDDLIEKLRLEPEMSSVDSFIQSKFDNDDFEFNFIELHALARNLTQERLPDLDVSEARIKELTEIKTQLSDLGFKFVGRAFEKSVRGITSNPHGKHPFAGSGAGGSGFSNMGAMGSGKSWDSQNSSNLSMGASKRR